MDDQIVNQIYISRKTILNQLSSQGYNTIDHENKDIHEIRAMIKTKQCNCIVNHPLLSTKVFIDFLITNNTIRINDINILLRYLMDEQHDIDTTMTINDILIIVAKEPANDTLNEELNRLWETNKIFIITRDIKSTQFNILKHVLVPSHHIIYDEKEVQDIMLKFKIKNKDDFLRYDRFDPVVRAIGLKPGQLCLIIRSSETAILVNCYRICTIKR